MLNTEEYWEDIHRVCDGIRDISDMRGKSIMVFGATGLIGSAVSELLFGLNRFCRADLTVYLAGRSREKMIQHFLPLIEGKDYHYIWHDALRQNQLPVSTDYIIYGAGYGDPTAIMKDPVSVIVSNTAGLKNVLDQASETGTKRVLYISSSEVYGNKADNKSYREADYGYIDILNPRACYPEAKRLAEALCVAYGYQHGLETVIARPGHIYGPTITQKDSRAAAQFAKSAAAGENIVLKSEGTQLRSYCYGLDCASAMITMLLYGETGTAYNISDQNSYATIRELAEAFSRAAGCKVVFDLPSEKEKKSFNLMSNSSLNGEMLMGLGWRALFDVETGAERTIRYLRELQRPTGGIS